MSDTIKMIAELKELWARATPGPWKEARDIWHKTPENAALIVAMRNALPELIDIAEGYFFLKEDYSRVLKERNAALARLAEVREAVNQTVGRKYA